jgi:Zn-dependent protease with chaperone function
MPADAPSILALANGGQAQRAGLRDDDVIIAVDGEPWAKEPQAAQPDFSPLRGQLDRLDQAFAAGPVRMTIRREGHEFSVAISGEMVCAARIQLDLSSVLSAEADDKTIAVSLGLVEFARDDSELAFIVGHELAHIILRHRDLRLTAGAAWSDTDQVAAERAADDLGRTLMAQAGYAPVAAGAFWARLGQTHPESRTAGGGHPSVDERAAAAR